MNAYRLSTATSNGTLLISLLGHQSITQRFDAENPGPFHFTLIPVDSRLEEVEVSTGYERLPPFDGDFERDVADSTSRSSIDHPAVRCGESGAVPLHPDSGGLQAGGGGGEYGV